MDRAGAAGWMDCSRAWVSNDPVQWHVHAREVGGSVAIEYDGVLTARFAADGRCAEHREWFSRRPLED